MRLCAPLMLLLLACDSTPSATVSPEDTNDRPVEALACSKGGKRLGTLRFPKGGAPALALEVQGADADAFKALWDKLLAQGEIDVKVHENRDDEQPLVGIRARPGEPGYGRVVDHKLADHGYHCEDVPPGAAR
ncbi:hypothetical protein [Polyangium spumosum]|uniref:Lipoprotein n=1 Tax=Polyangium spumosum TaxID=889282 RepID=A0A6N7PEC5_9BACT|nr:hypothetical protein [Polyangium spumosum]MRG90412.1 hypothetical protein [Polyangium spumosum]